VLIERGRGFVVEGARGRLVITAARCLPHLPASMDVPFAEDGLYPNLLAPLRKAEKVWAKCLFADPVGDLAVLGPPHGGPALATEMRDYDALMKSVGVLPVGYVQGDTSAWLMMRDRGWFQCAIGYPGRGPLLVLDAAALKGSMCGSPIVADAGLAIGVVTSAEAEEQDRPVEQPVLTDHLPGWLLRDLGLAGAREA